MQSVGEMCIIKKDYINAVWHCAAAGGLETNMICNTILEAVGRTPVIRLSRMTVPDMAEVLVKFEGLNVGGSIKTRTAYNMILDAEKKGLIGPGTVIVEPTSGNQGINYYHAGLCQ